MTVEMRPKRTPVMQMGYVHVKEYVLYILSFLSIADSSSSIKDSTFLFVPNTFWKAYIVMLKNPL